MDLPLLHSVLQAGIICVTAVTAVCEAVEEEHHRKRPKTDQRTLSRSQRRKFNHDDALYFIKRDYLGKREEQTTPLFGAEFMWMFRVSRSRFQGANANSKTTRLYVPIQKGLPWQAERLFVCCWWCNIL
jgi:hypothetical protein